MSSVIAKALEACLEMDHIGTEVKGDKTVYIFKTTSIIPSLVELKAKILSLLDFPMDIPENVEVEEVKHGIVFKEYIVRITVPRYKLGRLSNLLARKYGILRKRPYSSKE